MMQQLFKVVTVKLLCVGFWIHLKTVFVIIPCAELPELKGSR